MLDDILKKKKKEKKDSTTFIANFTLQCKILKFTMFVRKIKILKQKCNHKIKINEIKKKRKLTLT